MENPNRKLVYIPTLHQGDDQIPGLIEMFGNEDDLKILEQKGDSLWESIRGGIVDFVIGHSLDELQFRVDLSSVKVFAEGMEDASELDAISSPETHVRDPFVSYQQIERAVHSLGLNTPQGILEAYLKYYGATIVPTEKPGTRSGFLEKCKTLVWLHENADDQNLSDDDFFEKLLEVYGEWDELQMERDEHVSAKINDELKKGETGILIFGAGHNIIDRLDEDIEVNYISNIAREVREYVDSEFNLYESKKTLMEVMKNEGISFGPENKG